jgi:hypothetical protein
VTSQQRPARLRLGAKTGCAWDLAAGDRLCVDMIDVLSSGGFQGSAATGLNAARGVMRRMPERES